MTAIDARPGLDRRGGLARRHEHRPAARRVHVHDEPRRTGPPRRRRAPTVFGMSWSFRSRKTRGPSAATSRDERRALRDERLEPDLQPADARREPPRRREDFRRASGSRARCRRDRPPGAVIPPLPPRASPAREPCARPTRSARRRRGAAQYAASSSDEPSRDAGIPEVRRPDLDRRRARREELEHVGEVRDPADPDERRARKRLRDLVDHAHGERPDRGPGEPARPEREARARGLGIDRHADERVDEREHVGAGVAGGARGLDEVGRVRRELHDERAAASPRGPAPTSEAVAGGELPKSIPPRSTFGQEMLSSIAASPSASSSARDDRDVVLLEVAPDVRDHRGAELAQARQLLLEEDASTPTFCSPIAFSMPDGRLADARRRVARVRLEREALRADAAELREVDEVRELEAVAERARTPSGSGSASASGPSCTREAPRDPRSPADPRRSAGSAPPGRRRETARPAPGMTHARHAPKPQPIAASVENSAGDAEARDDRERARRTSASGRTRRRGRSGRARAVCGRRAP